MRRGRHGLTGLVAGGLVAASLLSGSASAWTTHLIQLDNGTCGLNLQIGSDKTASSVSTPSFWLQGDGAIPVYDTYIDGRYIGRFTSNGSGNVCIITTAALADGAHQLDGQRDLAAPAGSHPVQLLCRHGRPDGTHPPGPARSTASTVISAAALDAAGNKSVLRRR